VDDLERLWRGIDVHAITAEVIQGAAQAAIDHRLRAYDSLHLATALALAEVERVTFVCWDRDLRGAARKHGLALVPERL
jgi:predicted nucleic acid-binding protein